MTDAPTAKDFEENCAGRYRRLIGRRIGARYLIVFFNLHTFCFGVTVQSCDFGIVWYSGPFSLCFAKPKDENHE